MTRISDLVKRSGRRLGIAAIAGGAALMGVQTVSAQVQVDEDLPRYERASGVSGSIKSVGSDTLNNLMTLWAEEFNKFYPNVSVEVEGKGSSTAPPALIQGQAQLGPMSRAMKNAEIDEFQARYGYAPTPLRTAIDALAVFVHKDNPIESLTLEQLRQIFSVDGPNNLTWGALGVDDARLKDQRVSLYGRNSASGTYGYFKEVALGDSDFRPGVKEQPGSSSVVQGIASDRNGIGYSGVGYATADVKMVPISSGGGEAYEPTVENAYTGDYPLARFLYVYVNIPPGQQPTPIVREFVRLIFSQQGQQVVVKDGYFPVTNTVAEQDLEKIGAD